MDSRYAWANQNPEGAGPRCRSKTWLNLRREPLVACAALLLAGAAAGQESVPKPVPPFIELEAAGAIIGEIRVFTDNIFDTRDPHENNFVFRAANAIHI